jgi:hypothetical protein
MRALRGLSAGLTVAVGALAVAVLAPPASAAPAFGATLTLDPTSGKPGTTITATFQVNQGIGICRMRVTYRWDGHKLGDDGSNDCTSTVKFKAQRGVGSHVVSAADSTTRLSALATFTVTTADGSPEPTKTRTGQPTPTGGQSANADPLPIDTGQQAQPSLPPPRADAVPQVKTSSSFSGWILAFGSVLILGGVVILVLIFLRMRKGDDPEDDQGPLRDFPTQQIPVGHLTSLDDHGYRTGPGADYGRHAQ